MKYMLIWNASPQKLMASYSVVIHDTVPSDKHARLILTEIFMAHKAIAGMGI
jgi:hypothetical protein